MLCTIYSAALNGLTCAIITVEYDAHPGDGKNIRMVGLPDNAVRESYGRVNSALMNNRYHFAPCNLIVNFAPADFRKEGTGFDLPLAIGKLATEELVDATALAKYVIVGELGLDGSVRPIKGALPIAIKARAMGFERLIVPQENAREAAVVNQLEVYGVRHFKEAVELINGRSNMAPTEVDTRAEFYAQQTHFAHDFSDVRGQEHVKRAFEVAAAGGHNLLLVGSPGCGKSMMSKRIPSILPPLTLQESLETTQLHSIAGKLQSESTLIAQRPFRSPHHTISDVALIGGGSQLQPGEISLSHNGVLFMDELPEFSRNALETLRQPLEDRQITISRAKYTATLPCSFMLVASMNPCPCGYYNHPNKPCTCTPQQRLRYIQKISGPLLDRIDLQVEVTPVPFASLAEASPGEPSAIVRERVLVARQRQNARFKDEPGVHCNAQMSSRHVQTYAQLDATGAAMLQQVMQRLDLSARAYERILKVARTIADLAGEEHIQTAHLAEAIGYRNLDRSTWGL